MAGIEYVPEDFGKVVEGFARANKIVTVQLSDDETPSWVLTVADKDIWVDHKRPTGFKQSGWGTTPIEAMQDLLGHMGPGMWASLGEGMGKEGPHGR